MSIVHSHGVAGHESDRRVVCIFLSVSAVRIVRLVASFYLGGSELKQEKKRGAPRCALSRLVNNVSPNLKFHDECRKGLQFYYFAAKLTGQCASTYTSL